MWKCQRRMLISIRSSDAKRVYVDATTALEAARTGLAPEGLFEDGCDEPPSVELAFDPGCKVEPSLLGGLVADLSKGRPPLLSGYTTGPLRGQVHQCRDRFRRPIGSTLM